MADAGLNALEKAIFARLNTASVTTLVPADRHMTTVIRPESTYPVITVAYMGSDPDRLDSFSGDAETVDYIIRAWAENSYTLETVTDIAEAVDARLVGATLSVTGYTSPGVFGIRRVRWIRGIETDHREVLFMPRKLMPYPYAGAIYRFWTQRS